jgi:hypothetical protein
MGHIYCPTEQKDQPALARLPEGMDVTARPLAELARDGWERPLILLGDGLDDPGVQALLQRTYRNPAPALVLPPLPVGDVTALLDAPAPVTVVRQRADTLELTDDALRKALGRDTLHVYCTEAMETPLRTGTLAMVGGKPVIWAYRPTRASTPVIWVAAQLLLVSARTDPLDREELLSALLVWAETRVREGKPGLFISEGGKATEATDPRFLQASVDPGVLRALVVAWAVRPSLTRRALPGWLQERLFVPVTPADLDTALEVLRMEGVLDAQNRPQVEQLSDLVDEWGLRAWVREAVRADEGQG